MSRGRSYGGGKSSLNYLFEQNETDQSFSNSTAKPAQNSRVREYEKTNKATRTSTVLSKPGDKPDQTKQSMKTKVVQDGKLQKHTVSDTLDSKYHGQNAVHFHTGRPSTKVNSVPGGQSSLGYLFGDG